MIEESYVSFDTAKMLKEVGFDVPCFNQYTERGTIWHCDCPENFNKSQCATSCPTQALAARWLREVYGIHVYANYYFEDCDWFYVTVDLKESDPAIAIQPNENSYKSAEAALEAGLQETIKLIKK